jgi:hypothetical protein
LIGFFVARAGTDLEAAFLARFGAAGFDLGGTLRMIFAMIRIY